MNQRTAPNLLSVVVPCYNEEAVIEATHARLTEVLGRLGVRCEVIYADDGSRDRTADILDRIRRSDPRVRVVTLARNFGHQAAASAGLEHARGDAVVLIDADLQDPPEVIPGMLERWRAGVDVVYGQRTSREGESFFKLLTARVFYRLLTGIAERPVPVDTGDFRLMDRSVVDCLVAMPEQDRFLRGMVAWIGFRQEPLAYARAARLAGETKYPFHKMLRLAVDAFISLSRAPVRLLWWLCGGTLAAASLAAASAGLLALAGRDSHTAAVVAAVLGVGGLNLVGLTIVAEYAARIYRQVRGRPLWITRSVHGFPEAATTAADRPRRAA
ncbi:MAG: glycosyltransferase [Planctomycetia bacterium]|nr:glycosyltransferase [Planctomycetia bacterium]